MPIDRDAWNSLGGDLRRLSLYEEVGKVAPFALEDSRCLASMHPDTPEVGTIGDWVGSEAVLREAESWLSAHGCKKVRGPVEMCTWFPHGASLGPFEDAPFVTEPLDRADRWLGAGYSDVAHFVAAVAEHDAQIRTSTDRVARLSMTGWTVRQLALDPGEGRPSEASYREAIHLLHQIRSESYSKVPNFADVSESVIQEWYRPLRQKVDPRLVMIGRSPEGEPAGILFALPDADHSERGWFVVNTLGVRPKFRQAGLAAWLVAAAHQSARKSGYKAGVHLMPWEREHLPLKDGFHVIRKYAVLEKSLKSL